VPPRHNHHAVSPHLGTPTRYPAATSSVTPVDNRSPMSTAARPRSRRGKRTCSRKTRRDGSPSTSHGCRSCSGRWATRNRARNTCLDYGVGTRRRDHFSLDRNRRRTAPARGTTAPRAGVRLWLRLVGQDTHAAGGRGAFTFRVAGAMDLSLSCPCSRMVDSHVEA
jgi:hypothetical protein